MDINPCSIGWVTLNTTLIMASDEIQDVDIKAFKSDDPELDGVYIVQITKKTPTVEIIAASEAEAEELYKEFKSAMKVININERKHK